MVTTVPSLSEDGWVTDSGKMLDYLFSYYLLTDVQQSHLFAAELVSLPKTYFEHINNPDALAGAIRADFSKLLERYFASSEVNCYSKKDAVSESLYYVFLSATVTDADGALHELNKIAQLKDGRSSQVIQYSNYGDAYNDFGGL